MFRIDTEKSYLLLFPNSLYFQRETAAEFNTLKYEYFWTYKCTKRKENQIKPQQFDMETIRCYLLKYNNIRKIVFRIKYCLLADTISSSEYTGVENKTKDFTAVIMVL